MRRSELLGQEGYSTQQVSNLSGEILFPGGDVDGFMCKWLKEASNNKLVWFANQKKISPIKDATVKQSFVNDLDLEVILPALPEDLASKVLPVEIGISHCCSTPLHGDVLVSVTNSRILELPQVKHILSKMKIGVSCLDHISPFTQVIIDHSETSPFSLSLVTGSAQNDILKVFGIKKETDVLAYFDPEVRKIIASAVKILIEEKLVRVSFPGRNPSETYSRRLIEAKLGPYGYDEYDDVTDSERLRQVILDSLRVKQDSPLGQGDLEKALLRYYESAHVEGFLNKFPRPRVQIKLISGRYDYLSDKNLTFSEFIKMVQGMVPQVNMPKIPENAQRLGDIPSEVQNLIITAKDGFRIGFYISRSSGICSLHSVRK